MPPLPDPPMPRKPGFLAMPAVHPQGTGIAAGFAWIAVSTGRRLASHGPKFAFHELLALVPETVIRPSVILRLEIEGSPGWCYARHHAKGCHPSGVRVQAPHDNTFAVFLSRRMIILDWTWLPCDPADTELPLDDRTQDGVVAWRRTT